MTKKDDRDELLMDLWEQSRVHFLCGGIGKVEADIPGFWRRLNQQEREFRKRCDRADVFEVEADIFVMEKRAVALRDFNRDRKMFGGLPPVSAADGQQPGTTVRTSRAKKRRK